MQNKKKQDKYKKVADSKVDPVVALILIFIFVTGSSIFYYYNVKYPKLIEENKKVLELQKKAEDLKRQIKEAQIKKQIQSKLEVNTVTVEDKKDNK